MKNKLSMLTYVAVIAACSVAMHAAPPKGWLMAGTKPASYDSGVDPQAVLNGLPSAYMKSNQPVPDGFGTLMQTFAAGQYVGQRVRFSALVKTDSVESWAGLWMRVDDNSKDPRNPKMLAFDNMMDRPIKGTTAWQRYDVVLDVPQGATGIFFGVLMDGSGEVWLNDVRFEIVGTGVATTGTPPPPPSGGPTNLSFEK
jgi:hypothetical protein